MTLELLASGYGLVEGPRWSADGGLYFSDVHHGGVFRLAADGSVSTVVPKRRGVGGIVFHADGGIVMSGRDICHHRDGVNRTVYADPSVPGFNDLTTDAAGRLYIGTMRSNPFATDGERTFGECLRVDGEGTAALLYGGVSLTNGMGVSPDGRWLYHADTANHLVRRWALDGPQAEPEVHVHFGSGLPDGLAVDAAGSLWVAMVSAGTVQQVRSDGTLGTTIEVPSRMVTSCAFGGEDLADLYVVTGSGSPSGRDGAIYRTRVGAVGLPVPLCRV